MKHIAAYMLLSLGKEEKKEAPKAESDDDMGFGLFD